MGWNGLDFQKESPLLSKIKDGDCVYFVHSFCAVDCDDAVIATAEYGAPVTAAAIRFTRESQGKWHCYTRYFRAPDVRGGVLSGQWLCGIDSQDEDTPIYFDDLELYRISK
jgi:hypothetical protein